MYTCLINYFPLFYDFLLSALDEEKYGDRLYWIDRDTGRFALKWNHAGKWGWKKEDFAVFLDWDKFKGRPETNLKKDCLLAKGRFNSILNKAASDGCVRKMRSDGDRYTKVFELSKTCRREKCCGPSSPIMTDVEIKNTVEELLVTENNDTLLEKMTKMPLEQLEGEAARFRRYAELSQIINIYLLVRKNPTETNLKMMHNENGWYLSTCNRTMLIDFNKFDPPFEPEKQEEKTKALKEKETQEIEEFKKELFPEMDKVQ